MAAIAWLALATPVLAQPAPSPTPTPGAASPWAGTPDKKDFPTSSAIILKDDIQCTVNADGTTQLVEYDAIKLLDETGVKRFGRMTRLYDSRVESIEVPLARIWSPEGKVTVLPAGSIVDTVPEGMTRQALYQRIHELTIDYKDAVEGSVIEFRIVHNRKVPWPGKKFWEISYTQDFEPILDTQFTLDTPDRMPVEIATPGSVNMQPEQVVRRNGRTVMRWRMTQRPPLTRQPAMPPLRQLATQIQVGNFASWNDFATWARALWEQVSQADSAISAKAASLVAGLPSDAAKIKVIMAWLDKEKPPANGDLALEDVMPAQASEAFKAAELLPQDRAVLLLSMLRAAHIPALAALVATADHGDPSRGVPSLQQFNRVLVAVPAVAGGWTWLDPMAASPGVLGQGLDDRPALVLNGSPVMVSTSITLPEANREEINGVARLDSDGTMETVLKMSEYGAQSMVWRALAISAKAREQQQLFQMLVTSINPTAILRDFFVPAAPGDGPLQITVGFELSRAGTRLPGNEGFRFSVPLLPQRRLLGYAELPVSERLYPVVLGSTIYEQRRLQIVIPSGWTVKSLPRSTMRSNAIGSFQLDVRSDERNVYYFSRLIVRRTQIPLAEYSLFKELMDQLSAASTEHIVLDMPVRK